MQHPGYPSPSRPTEFVGGILACDVHALLCLQGEPALQPGKRKLRRSPLIHRYTYIKSSITAVPGAWPFKRRFPPFPAFYAPSPVSIRPEALPPLIRIKSTLCHIAFASLNHGCLRNSFEEG